jgi:DNA (cytosine-5)-methyltransferase 1
MPPMHSVSGLDEPRWDPFTFVDVFAGAGGLSLGLMRAGLHGLFAIEHEGNAFATLQANLINGTHGFRYAWPDWLPKRPISISRLLTRHRDQLLELRGTVDMLAGGPPCQGFSPAGRRRRNDPRNTLFRLYVEMARLLEPPFLVFENVPGIAVEFDKTKRQRMNPRRVGRPAKPFAKRIVEELEQLGYVVFVLQERASDFGVPQTRVRYLIIGVRRTLAGSLTEDALRGLIDEERRGLLGDIGLPAGSPVTVREAISDLETAGKARIACVDSPGFQQIVYDGPRTDYQRLLHGDLDQLVAPNSMRLVKHRAQTVQRFTRVLGECRKGVRIRSSERESLGISSITPLDPDRPSNTLTSLPDDFLHYSEPRVMTVREMARLQSFPDWFEFQGKYTTGGQVRKTEVPRYTQVANAVPPLLAEAIGRTLLRLHRELARDTQVIRDETTEAIAV